MCTNSQKESTSHSFLIHDIYGTGSAGRFRGNRVNALGSSRRLPAPRGPNVAPLENNNAICRPGTRRLAASQDAPESIRGNMCIFRGADWRAFYGACLRRAGNNCAICRSGARGLAALQSAPGRNAMLSGGGSPRGRESRAASAARLPLQPVPAPLGRQFSVQAGAADDVVRCRGEVGQAGRDVE